MFYANLGQNFTCGMDCIQEDFKTWKGCLLIKPFEFRTNIINLCCEYHVLLSLPNEYLQIKNLYAFQNWLRKNL